MTVNPLTPTSGRRDVGDRWLLGFEVRDDAGVLVDATIVVTVTRPDGSTSTPAAVLETTGIYTATYDLAAAGRHTAKVVASVGAVGVTGFAVDALPMVAARPDLTAVKAYLRDKVKGWSDAEVQGALDAETANQAKKCRIPATYPADLAEALKRRVACNLARRGLPLGAQTSEVGPVFFARLDGEVRRFEAGYPKLRVG